MTCIACLRHPALQFHAFCKSCIYSRKPACSCGLPFDDNGVCSGHCDVLLHTGPCDCARCLKTTLSIALLERYMNEDKSTQE